MIKHLCIPGGGPLGFNIIGALHYLEKMKFWDINNIESIYTISVGSIIAILISLKFEWDYIIDYFIKRPWCETFNINIEQILEFYKEKGLFNESFFIIILKPFFDSKNLLIHEITLEEFYNYTNIDLHLFSFELNKSVLTDINHTSFPNMKLIQAVHMTACIPFVFKPIYYNNGCYIDGCILCNYPIQYMLNNIENSDEILGIRYKTIKPQLNSIIEKNENDENNEDKEDKEDKYKNEEEDKNENILDFMMKVFNNLFMIKNINNGFIKNEIILYVEESYFISYTKSALFSEEFRLNLLEQGISNAKDFYTSLKE
jgi:predicted acylesterase/phospholipase RssA